MSGPIALRNDTAATTLAGTNLDICSLAVDSKGQLFVGGVSGTVSLPTGAATAAKQPALGTAGTASADVITVQGIAAGTALRVDLGPTTANATAIKVDGSAITQPVQETPATSGGLTKHRLLSAATTNATSVKGSAGQLYTAIVSNMTAAAKFFKLYDKASAPTVGTDTPVYTIPVQANSTLVIEDSYGFPFTLGLAYALTGAIGDADTTAVAANDMVVNLGYK